MISHVDERYSDGDSDDGEIGGEGENEYPQIEMHDA